MVKKILAIFATQVFTDIFTNIVPIFFAKEKNPWPFTNMRSVTACYYHVTYEFQNEFTLYSLPEYQGTPCLKQAPYL